MYTIVLSVSTSTFLFLIFSNLISDFRNYHLSNLININFNIAFHKLEQFEYFMSITL